MRKDKLYTVNKWNKPAFMGDRIHQNIFDGFDLSQMARNYFDGSSAKKTFDMNIGNSMEQQYLDSKNALGISKANNPFSKYNLAQAKEGLVNAGTGVAAAGIGMLGNAAGNAIAGGKTSAAGNVVGSLGSMALGAAGTAIGGPLGGAIGSAVGSVLGGLTNAAFGSELNEEKIAEVQDNNAKRSAENDALYSVNNTDDLFNSVGNMTNAVAFSEGDIGSDGWFSSDAEDKYDELKAEQERVNRMRGVAIGTTTNKVNRNQYINSMKSNLTALGGKLFADGGLQSAFMDEFGSDPIGAAMRYKQGLERQEAEKEEAAMNAAREAEYLANQQRLANLETQYQGLQALMSAMPTTNVGSYSEEFSESSSPSMATSKASGNKTWDYIEDQLKKSGKFNDTQIKGIKYNLQRESSINPDIEGDGGAAFGLAQWHGSRQPKDRSLEGQTKHLIETLSNFDGKEHWIGRENYEGFLNARTPEEAHYYIAKGYERPHKDIVAKVKRYSDMSLRNLNAFGGELGTNGADFTDGMIYIDEGGSHESNPLDGVPMGVDAEGIPNLVEEGETVYNDYVFSDRMKIPTFMYKELGLGGVMKKKGKGMSFADASKKLSQESEQRPNDPISKAGLDAALSRLAEVQETERMKQNAEEYIGLNAFAYGGQKGNILKGKGNKPNVLNVDNRSIVRRLFGDTKFVDFMENTSEALQDPINYFAGDKIEAIMSKVSSMTEPQLEEFFSTPFGQSIASAIATSNNSSNPNYQEAGIQRWAKATGRMAKPIQRTVVNAAKRAMQQSKQVAKGQGKVPKGGGKQQVLHETSTPIQQARQATTGSTSGLPEGWNLTKGNTPTSSVNGATSRLNPKSPTGKGATSRGVAPDPYAGLEGSMSFRTPAGSGNFGYLPQIAGAGAAGAAGYGAYKGLKFIADNLENPNYGLETNAVASQNNATTAYNPDKYTAELNKRRAAYYARKAEAEKVAQQQAAETQKDTAQKVAGKGKAVPGGDSYRAWDGVHADEENTPEQIARMEAARREAMPALGPGISLTEVAERTTPTEDAGLPTEATTPQQDIMVTTPQKNNQDPYPTWMRYAPAIGNGVMALTDALGITNKPDYTYADKLEGYARQAGNAPHVSYKPIGNYLRYNPMDIWFEQNRMDANARATDRAIMNNAAPIGTKMAGLLASGYNNQIADGQLYRSALEYNDAKRKDVAGFNRTTDMFNSQMGLEAAMANARYNQAAKQMGLSGLAQAAGMRDAIDQRVGAARSANLTNFLTSLGNIGRENFAMNQINDTKAAHNGYTGTLSGRINHSTAFGGKIKKRKR